MSRNFGTKIDWVRKIVFASTMAMIALIGTQLYGQPGNNNNNFFQTIGGIRIDASGILGGVTDQFKMQLREKLLEDLNRNQLDPAIAAKSQLRMISVAGIEAALQAAVESGQEIPDEIKYMAGIQRLQYVFVFPEKNDIVLAGFGEGWTVDDQGNVVGKTNGAPVIRLEDFLVAIQTANNARKDAGISVSIDPTKEGVEKVSSLFNEMRKNRQSFGPAWVTPVEEAMGPNTISLTGVPTDSRYANVLVAADHRMKRLAMGFEQAPVEKLPSILEIAQKRRKALDITPRFWLECNYSPVKKSEDGLAWEISGPGAKALTEEESLLDANAKPRKSHPVATQWAKSMTEQFAELSSKEVVFAELRNIMDMSVIAALIEKENMFDTAKLDAPLLTGKKDVEFPKWNSPKTVPSQCSYCSVGNNSMITVSGGIQIDSWGVLENTEVDNSISEQRALAASSQSSNSVYWNSN